MCVCVCVCVCVCFTISEYQICFVSKFSFTCEVILSVTKTTLKLPMTEKTNNTANVNVKELKMSTTLGQCGSSMLYLYLQQRNIP